MWSAGALRQFASWGALTSDNAQNAGLFEVDDASSVYHDFHKLPAVILPYFSLTGEPVTFGREGAEHHFCRVRYLAEPPHRIGPIKHKPQRYDQPGGSGVRAYFPVAAGVAWSEIAKDSKQALLITEGEAKALATTLAGFATIGLGGVFNYLLDGELLPELAVFKWHARDVFIVFDSDAASNPNIQYAEARLVDELMRKRGARVFLVRIPPNQDGSKCGLDDFILANGIDRLERLLAETDPLGAVDAGVIALNQCVAFIEREGQVYDIRARHFLKSEAFVRGGQYSSWKARRIVTTGRNPGVREVALAQEWLTHSLARRYGDLLFRPGEGPLVETDTAGLALNVWHGWTHAEGDIQPFLDLTEFLLSDTPEEHRLLPLQLMAYKAQHPEEKVPLALVLIGDPGSGKTLWTECLQAAFAPYAITLPSSALRDNFQGWLERTLLAVINEVEPEDLERGQDRLKALVSDLERPMNEKYRVARQIRSYTSYILTANRRAAGAFSHADRRMIVIGTPPMRREQAFYTRVRDWKFAGGGQALLHWLINVDLEGWRPPREAPMTPEKAMAYRESLSPVQLLADDSESVTGSTILLWINAALGWANNAAASNNPAQARAGQEIIDSYNTMQIRDWYTPEEMAMMFPHIASTLYGSKLNRTVAGEISRQMRDAGVPYLTCADDPRGFRWQGRIQQFLIICNREEWRVPITQVDFERQMKTWPKYCDVRNEAYQKGKRR